MFCVKRACFLKNCAIQTSRSLNSKERFLKGEAVNSNMYGPLRDGPDFTIVSSKTGEIPENPPLSTRKQQQVDKQWEIQAKIEEMLDVMEEASQISRNRGTGENLTDSSHDTSNESYKI
ncbi:hypothetical protein ACHWQZ_G016531 [Mnemiopsis leidyi]